MTNYPKEAYCVGFIKPRSGYYITKEHSLFEYFIRSFKYVVFSQIYTFIYYKIHINSNIRKCHATGLNSCKQSGKIKHCR